MEENKRDFKGIWIPKELWFEDTLSIQEKCFIAEIHSLDNEDGCFASNNHFSKLFNLSKNRCTEIIKNLEKKKVIKVEYEYENKTIKKRIIKLNRVFGLSNRGYSENLDRGIRNPEGGYSENCEDRITIENNNIDNIEKFDFLEDANKAKRKIDIQEIINRLNEKTGSQYRCSTRNSEFINARLNDYSVEDLLMMIDYMSDKWIGTDYQRFLRPETLFGLTKCEGYVEEARRETRQKKLSIYNETAAIEYIKNIVENFGIDHPAYIDCIKEATQNCIKAYGVESEEYERLMRVINELNSKKQ